ncbi:Peptidoglycan glycosyltransferase MrdB [bacterium HR40]|nr:Peptidoglycan glycosyltransferase MrdB [bacterium HR40]
MAAFEPVLLRPQELSLSEKLSLLNWPFVLLVVPAFGIIGYLVLYSAAGGAHEPWAWRHALRFALGYAVMLGVAFVDIRFWHRWAHVFYGLVIVLLLAVDIVGSINKGAQRWLAFGPFQLQPSELAKLALVLMLARFYHGLRLEDVGRPIHLIVPLALIGLPAALTVAQPDLGTGVLIVALGGGLMFLAGVRIWKFVLAGGLLAAAVPLVWTRLHDYQRERVLTFLDPERDPLGAGYHIIQSKIALGAGGLAGRGFLHGTQAQLDFLPEKQTDFAFTLLAEETGFVGAATVLTLCLMVAFVALRISLRATSDFGRLVAMGVGLNFSIHAVVNIAMVTGLVPVVGVPLPLISYGGTAMLTTLFGFGLMLSADIHRALRVPRHPGEL